MECCLHTEKGGNINNKIIQVSSKSGETILYYAKEWMKMQDEYGRLYGVIVSKLVNNILGDDQLFPASCGYFQKCYQAFTNKKNLGLKKRSIQSSEDESQSIPRYILISAKF